MSDSARPTPGFLRVPTRFLFFTGKGGVGKTSVSASAAIALADAGHRVLLVSTDAASNLDDMLGAPLCAEPVPVPGVPGLTLLQVDPDAAAEAYRGRVLAQMVGAAEAERARVREELSGACTTEIAAFDAFAALLADEDGSDARGAAFVVFDTAPTGHTLRLLRLPGLWTGFLAGNDRGASCLGPHSGLRAQASRYAAALAALGDAARTTVVLVARPDRGALAEAARTAAELRALGITRQRLVVNGVFRASAADDAVALAMQRAGEEAVAAMPAELAGLPRDDVPLLPFDTVGLAALRALGSAPVSADARGIAPAAAPGAPGLDALVDALAAQGHGLVMVMGKGGVGKTTVAAAVAVGLVQRGHSVLLTTTDPAAHLAGTVEGVLPGLTVGRIDPAAETRVYIERVMATRGARLSPEARDLLREDLQSPCTEEVAVFHAFSRVVNQARSAFVVLDTAPTGHSLLLMDATGAYHRQMTRDAAGIGSITTPLMRLQDPALTRVLLVTLPETTPVTQAAALEADLRRAGVEPWAWVLNRTLLGSGTRDPVLAGRLAGEARQVVRVRGLARRLYAVPWQAGTLTGVPALAALVTPRR